MSTLINTEQFMTIALAMMANLGMIIILVCGISCIVCVIKSEGDLLQYQNERKNLFILMLAGICMFIAGTPSILNAIANATMSGSSSNGFTEGFILGWILKVILAL